MRPLCEREHVERRGKDEDPNRDKRISFHEVAVWFRELEGLWLLPSETLVSRSLFADLFALLGRGALSMRLAEKA